jgi:hypothetical protein
VSQFALYRSFLKYFAEITILAAGASEYVIVMQFAT